MIWRVIGCAAILVCGAASAQSVVVTGLNGESRTLTPADLAALPRASAVLKSPDGKAVRYEGAPLSAVLQSVGAPSGRALHGAELADIVVVTARDGYRVALSLAETDPAMRPLSILLADTADGAALPAGEGPLRLVVEGDLRAARSARMVESLKVERAP